MIKNIQDNSVESNPSNIGFSGPGYTLPKRSKLRSKQFRQGGFSASRRAAVLLPSGVLHERTQAVGQFHPYKTVEYNIKQYLRQE
jgi:hypothetical protein